MSANSVTLTLVRYHSALLLYNPTQTRTCGGLTPAVIPSFCSDIFWKTVGGLCCISTLLSEPHESACFMLNLIYEFSGSLIFSSSWQTLRGCSG